MGDEATVRYRNGQAFAAQGAWDAALAEFLASEQHRRSWQAAAGAARCLEKLGRYDESLDRFEALLREHSASLTAEFRAQVQERVDALRRLVGLIEVDGAEPGAAISVDGRRRGEYPLVAPLRVPVGSHVVRVVKEGFEPFEARVEVAGGKFDRVDARLVPLQRAGRLHVAERSGRAFVVVVDGIEVGKTPWDGQLSPGEHVVALRGDGIVGSAPMRVVVEESRTVPLTLAAEELAASLRVESVPANATIAIDGVTVGRGIWEGRLHAGKHRVEMAAPGFMPARYEVNIARGGWRVMRIDLGRDLRSPFRTQTARFTAEMAVGVPLLASFGGQVAIGCTAAPSCKNVLQPGLYTIARAGYELASRIGFGIAGGYVASSELFRGRPVSFSVRGQTGPTSTYTYTALVDDSIWARAGLAGAWAGVTFGDRVPIHLRLGAGALLGTASDARSDGTLPSAQSRTLWNATATHPLRAAYLAPEARVGLVLGPHAELSLGIDMLLVFQPSPPTWGTYSIPVTPYLPTARAGGYHAEVYSSPTLVALTPALAARYDF